MISGLAGSLVSLITAAAGAATAGAHWAWQESPVKRHRRRARRALRPVAKEVAAYHEAAAPWEQDARHAAAGWAATQREQRLAGVSLETLRDAGASNVRWNVLREAGLTTLADVLDKKPRELARLHGVGRATAAKVLAAAREVAARVADEPPTLPRADLSEPGSEALAAGALQLLEASELSGSAPTELAREARNLSAQVEALDEPASFKAWARSLLNPVRARKEAAAARSVADRAEALRDGALPDAARAGRERLAAARAPTRGRPADPATFRDRYAECCTLLGDLYEELGLVSLTPVARGRGGVSEEVARRVEEHPLDATGLSVTLRRYQTFGARYLLAQRRTILGDEMGLGKTMQSLAAMLHLRNTEGARRFVAVAPAGILVNWQREVEARTDLSAYLLHGDELEERLERWVREGGVAVTSYATLRNIDLGASLEQADGTVDMLVVDEAHFAKNPEAGRTRAVARLAARSQAVCLMSGTPMENHPDEFLNLIELVRPEEGSRLRASNIQLDAAAGTVARFHREVAAVYLRRNQEDVLTELPERIEVDEWVDLSPQDLSAYRETVAAGNFMAMRRCSTLGVLEGMVDEPVQPDGLLSAKLEHLSELMEDHRESGRKVIIFSYFLDVLKSIAQRFETVGTVHGGISPADRQELVDALGAAEGHAILLLQIQAGGQGLNIQSASAVVITEPQTKPSLESQAIARAHRMGQTRPVLVHRLLARDTCDETMLDLLAGKRELFEAYARKSEVKEASRQATETSLAKAVVAAEQEKLDKTTE